MTTIDVRPTPSPRTRLRLTRRGRRALASVTALPAVVAVSIAVISGGGALASSEAGAPQGSFTSVTVMSGDSLWTIAEEVAPQADPRDVVDAIIRLNALGSGQLDAGQTLAIPAEYATES
ncbi:LysM peptidoglycan-binding domain-containing protein [Microbacterium thalli]|uniref:LysM peptidoglycan-binding domain-containing protein n=1 Tax=Microbacterium thalli TaxID=3027921 RepID=A0ABT5SHW7_9MICO|nr:LysM peptidoglycan-binding domain-containing protein [Microbacterium thalli]MDD7930300.1 LysM peptidoglycan-binding domain-containing protein [Microbacterium thalli]MDD7962316.1 LysM peptidoglycan-binding domain-containing protein [Microbacterium thalli]MDN8548398.1 LysM peptidoglycan-binding domain-containing protein [Microbacterium thalli]